jgi:NADPH-dependent 2,4-dienoyl-CoA reductase/sulfur reductase-like enzyme
LQAPGADRPGVLYLRTLDDAMAISTRAEPVQRAVIVGGGFIGMELAGSLTMRGVKTTVIEHGPYLCHRFLDEPLGEFFRDYAARRGVRFLLDDSVARIDDGGGALAVTTGSGETLPADFVCVAIGIAPNVELARRAGLRLGDGVLVDEFARTSHPDIFAAGDIMNYPDPHFDRRRRVEHWGQADYTGRLAGENMAGGVARYDLLTYVWSDLFDLHLEFAGDESRYDHLILRGSVAEASFAALYVRDGRLTAYFAVNRPKHEYKDLGHLIQDRVEIRGKEDLLQNADSDVGILLHHPAPPG